MAARAYKADYPPFLDAEINFNIYFSLIINRKCNSCLIFKHGEYEQNKTKRLPTVV